MHSGNHRASRMKHQRNPGGKKRSTISAGDFCCEFFRKISANRRKIHPGFFEDSSVLHNPTASASPPPPFSRPQIFAKRSSIQLFKPLTNPVLKFLEIQLCSLTPHDRMIAGVWHNLEMQSERLENENNFKKWV